MAILLFSGTQRPIWVNLPLRLVSRYVKGNNDMRFDETERRARSSWIDVEAWQRADDLSDPTGRVRSGLTTRESMAGEPISQLLCGPAFGGEGKYRQFAPCWPHTVLPYPNKPLLPFPPLPSLLLLHLLPSPPPSSLCSLAKETRILLSAKPLCLSFSLSVALAGKTSDWLISEEASSLGVSLPLSR
ncbi:hypothetical protein CRG98_002069, partial [Punica granatum]